MKVTILGCNTNHPLTKHRGVLNRTKGFECGFRRFRSEARTVMMAFLKRESLGPPLITALASTTIYRLKSWDSIEERGGTGRMRPQAES
jgi:hypothetical protein